MKYIISATNRANSKTFKTARIVQKIYQNLDCPIEIISLKSIDFSALIKKPYSNSLDKNIQQVITKINKSSGLVIICPEYNGSFPGIFKFFIDHWTYPETFEFRPMSFIGLGGQWGGLRAVEQMKQIMGYRKAFIYPESVFLRNIEALLKQNKIQDPQITALLNKQAKNFLKFISALEKTKFKT